MSSLNLRGVALVLSIAISGCKGGTTAVRPDGAADAAPDLSGATDALAMEMGPADLSVADMNPAEMGPADALTAFRLFNTGVGADGVLLAGGSVDPHYKLIQSADTTFTGPDAIVADPIADGYWVANSDTSKWIAPSANQQYPGASPCNASGTYVYRTTFDLTGYNPTTLKISGMWAADNSGTDIRLNGASLGISAPGYAPLTAFTIDSGFVAGMNTLEFEILDIGCPNGLRVELTASDVAPAP
ncbi:MAG: hypothetical protein QOI66_2540 [Myxococcales bacterium]|jgi:hypothetical protein|nr:hypothetical protein [Myxococcales bacterium]